MSSTNFIDKTNWWRVLKHVVLWIVSNLFLAWINPFGPYLQGSMTPIQYASFVMQLIIIFAGPLLMFCYAIDDGYDKKESF
jgi:hypothetical protein